MKLEHEFTVKTGLADTWALLTDLERIAPCMPGAELIGREGNVYKGRVKVKLGPVLAQYEGKASFVEKDDAARRGVLRAEGRETKGQGSAKATVTAALAEAQGGTRVSVQTDLAIVGRLAQMGRGLIAEVSGKLLGEFVANLEREIGASGAAAAGAPVAGGLPGGGEAAHAAPAAASTAGDISGAGTISARPPAATAGPREAAPVDLLATAGVPVLKRLVPLVALVVAVAAALIWLL